MPLKLDFYLAYELEKVLQSIFAEHRYKPLKKFGGYTECFEEFNVDLYKKIIKEKIPHSFYCIDNLEITWR